MNYIKSLHINGFKKFKHLDINFNEHVNILVGENEAGKSTILDAIKIVLNQQYRNADKSYLKDLFNIENINAFNANPSIENLPQITIEIEFDLDIAAKNSEYFFGEVYGEQKPQDSKFGIAFKCEFDRNLGSDVYDEISSGKIPYEYYSLTWKTFGNKPYQLVKKPLKFISIDISGKDPTSSFNYYNRNLFNSIYEGENRLNIKYQFRDKLEGSVNDIGLEPIDDKRVFGIDSKKVPLESILSVYDNQIALENHGSGMECLIKTQIALDKKSGLNVVLMEEPENHLCFSTMKKMLGEIIKQKESSQLIITTHSNMIASHLNLKNILWISNEKAMSLQNLKNDDAEFFMKADDNAFLQLLLSKKAILVEGATECLLIPHFYKQQTGHTIEEDEITIISCGGISYKRYLSAVENLDKKIAVITDNDGNQERINKSIEFNNIHENEHIFMGEKTADWTWEQCIYDCNKTVLEQMISIQDGSKYLFREKDYGPYLGKMLNDKAEIAYQMLTSGKIFVIPEYVKEAITWLSE